MAKGLTRHELTQEVLERKERLWGQGDRYYNSRRSAENVVYGAGKNGPPDIALLRWAANATDAELMAAAGSRDSDYAFLFYK